MLLNVLLFLSIHEYLAMGGIKIWLMYLSIIALIGKKSTEVY